MEIIRSFLPGEVDIELIHSTWDFYEDNEWCYGEGYRSRRSVCNNYRYNYDMYVALIQNIDFDNINLNAIRKAIELSKMLSLHATVSPWNNGTRWSLYEEGFPVDYRYDRTIYGIIDGTEFKCDCRFDLRNNKINYNALYQLIEFYKKLASSKQQDYKIKQEFKYIYELAVFDILCVQGRNIAYSFNSDRLMFFHSQLILPLTEVDIKRDLIPTHSLTSTLCSSASRSFSFVFSFSFFCIYSTKLFINSFSS